MQLLKDTIIDDYSQEIITDGFTKTAQSFELFINSQVTHSTFSENIIAADFGNFIGADEDRMLLLKTEMVGPILGINYLILSKAMAQRICNHVFDGIPEANSTQEMIEFLKEMENVLAASTITTLSDHLGMDIYGDVPKIQAVDPEHLNSIIHQEISNISPRLGARASFDIKELGVRPAMFWFFNKSFNYLRSNLKSA